jgi:nucleoside-diphosphate-sugar epimerase
MSRSVFERVLVTGGTGFLGSYVLKRLGKAVLVQLDLTDEQATSEVIRSYRPQAVLHLAGVTGSGDPEGKRCHAINVTATRNLLRALDETRCERIVMVGSASEYGSQLTPFSEEMDAMPITKYGASKAEATRIALEMHGKSGLPVTVLRVFSAYGYRQPKSMFLTQAITHALRGERFEMTDGSQRRDFVYIDDVAEAIIRALYSENVEGRIINVGSGHSYPLADVAKVIWNQCQADPDLIALGVRSKTGDDNADTEADITLAGQLLEWRPRVPFLNTSEVEGGLARMIRQMKSENASDRDHSLP